MNIKDIMSSNLITCDKDATLNDVSIKMKNYDIGFIPISDEKKIIGVITDRDIVVNALANNSKGMLYSRCIFSFMNPPFKYPDSVRILHSSR